jgi:WNK lysine deficient protein kinase
MKAVKNWVCYVLEGLNYLHNHNPCIIQRDLNCNSIHMNGNSDVLNTEELDFSTIVANDHTAHTIICTSEFMAPELYEEDYNQHIDVYSFGMCILEMVTLEIPYS